MMSVIVKGMEMPKDCYDCPLHDGENGRCNILGITVYDYIPKECPLVEKMPVVLSERKKGKWMCHDAREGFLIAKYTCSICDYYSGTQKTGYCPNCGAKMEV